MTIDELISSFLQIVQCVSLEHVLIDSNRPFREVLSEQIDALDFELAVSCFEATHRVILDYGELADAEFESLTVEQLMADYLVKEARELHDPLFVTRRFCLFRESLLELLRTEEE